MYINICLHIPCIYIYIYVCIYIYTHVKEQASGVSVRQIRNHQWFSRKQKDATPGHLSTSKSLSSLLDVWEAPSGSKRLSIYIIGNMKEICIPQTLRIAPSQPLDRSCFFFQNLKGHPRRSLLDLGHRDVRVLILAELHIGRLQGHPQGQQPSTRVVAHLGSPKWLVEGSLETKVPTIWTDEKQHSQEEAEPGRNSDV